MTKVMFISSEGGHLYELQQLDFERYDYSVVTEKTKTTKPLKEKYKNKVHYLLYGTRKNPVKYLFVMLFNFFISLYLFIKIRPKVIISTGAHTAILMCYIGKLFRAKIIWIETYANRYSKTLSGKLVYNIADTFIVQWEEMKELYPKAVYYGSIL